ncbi:glycosyltransferase [Geminicoccus roseus]|uniref:glycosyltransferase n=1 Tax=Geminicoccus roseus TaxID=404900 RepID=UPI000420B79E|nr:glycosyltransferase [Geminicoccus roseus]
MTGHDVLVCFGFEQDRIRRQPWHVARGIALGLRARGRRVTMLTDAAAPPAGEPFAVASVPRLFGRDEPTRATREALAELRPERIFVVVGIHEFLRPGRFRLGAPTFLVVAAQPFRLGDFLRIAPLDLWRERHLLGRALLGSLLPGAMLRRGFRASGASGLVFVSEAAKARFAELGIEASVTIHPQVEPPAAPPARVGTWIPTILYSGPPLALRGADLALQSFEYARAAGLTARLQLLLRPDDRPEATQRFLARVERSPWRASIEVVTGMLSADEMSRRLSAADVHLLPFRVTVSDAPLVVIEAGLTGRPVVVLDTAGVTEFARAFDGLVAASADALPDALRQACSRPRQAVAAQGWTRWEQAVAPLAELAPLGPERLGTVALIGIDGAGKSVLAQRLQARLADAGHRSTHVWSRFRNYLSKPLLALARLTGHNRKLVVGGVKVGVHDFENRYGRPFVFLQRIDLVLDAWLRVRPASARGLVVMDRCALDQLVDVAVDTGLDDELIDRLAPRLFALLPQPAKVVLVEREPLLIGRTRPDALMDPKLLRRRAVYRRLAARLGLPVLLNDGSIEAADQQLDRIVGLAPPSDALRAQG